MNADVKLLDLKEYLYAQSYENEDGLLDLLRVHRFDVMSWLMMNGVAIPAELLADQTHDQQSVRSKAA